MIMPHLVTNLKPHPAFDDGTSLIASVGPLPITPADLIGYWLIFLMIFIVVIGCIIYAVEAQTEPDDDEDAE